MVRSLAWESRWRGHEEEEELFGKEDAERLSGKGRR